MSKVLMAGVAAVLLVGGVAACARRGAEPIPGAPAGERAASPAQVTIAVPTPRLVDVGAGKCIPCKGMAPILEGLKADYAGRLEVLFVDVWQNPDAAKPYGIRMIPTQIFYAADGKELARHEGFMGKDEILAQWKRSGVSF